MAHSAERVAMFEQLTEGAWKVLQLADQEALRFDHEYVGTEHILLALVKGGTGTAATVLTNLGVKLETIRSEIEEFVHREPSDTTVVIVNRPQTPRAKRVIEHAMDEARNLDHNHVGTEHLLLGLLREKEGVAGQVLINLGLKPDNVFQEVVKVSGDRRPNPEGSPAATIPPEVTDHPLVRQLSQIVDDLTKLMERCVEKRASEDAANLRDQISALNVCKGQIICALLRNPELRSSEG